MQVSNSRNANNSTTEWGKKKIKTKASLKKKPSLPRSLHVEQKIKTPRVWCKCNFYIFKPQNILKILRISYWILLSIAFVPFVIGIIGLGHDGSEWYGRVPKIQRIVFPIYLSISIIQALICSWQISKIYSIQIRQRISVIILLLFAAAYIFLAIYGKMQFDEIYLNKDDSSTCLENIDEIFNPTILNDFKVAKENFCQKSQNCKCLIENPSLFSQKILLNFYYVMTGNGVSNVLSCPNIFDYSFSSRGPKTIENLELKYNCSGICQPESIFYFSNINRGTPKEVKSCYSIVLDELNIVRRIISLPVLIISSLMVILLIQVALAARQYLRDPECLVLRMASFQKSIIENKSNFQHQKSLSHSIQNVGFQQNNLNMIEGNNNNHNNSSVLQMNGLIHNEEKDFIDHHNNSQLDQPNSGQPSNINKEKIAQSILINSPVNESRQSPANMINSGLQKKVTILTPSSAKQSLNQNNYQDENHFQKDEATIDVESVKYQPKGKIKFLKVENLKETQQQ